MLFENAELVQFLLVSMAWIQWIFLWLAGWTTKKQTANWRIEKINIKNGEEGNCATVMLVCVVGNRRRCGLNIREKTESEKGKGKKMAGGSEFCWKSSDISSSQSRKRLAEKFIYERNSTFFFGMAYECMMYIHTWTCALRSAWLWGYWSIHKYISASWLFYDVPFSFLNATSAAQTPLHLFGFLLLFFEPSFLIIICLCVVLFSLWPPDWPSSLCAPLPRFSSVYPIHLRPFSSISLFFF
jgi:hypothetical protein